MMTDDCVTGAERTVTGVLLARVHVVPETTDRRPETLHHVHGILSWQLLPAAAYWVR